MFCCYAYLHIGHYEDMPDNGQTPVNIANNSPVTAAATLNKVNRPTLAKIILSLDTMAAKQSALTKLLQALQIIYARWVE